MRKIVLKIFPTLSSRFLKLIPSSHPGCHLLKCTNGLQTCPTFLSQSLNLSYTPIKVNTLLKYIIYLENIFVNYFKFVQISNQVRFQLKVDPKFMNKLS